MQLEALEKTTPYAPQYREAKLHVHFHEEDEKHGCVGVRLCCLMQCNVCFKARIEIGPHEIVLHLEWVDSASIEAIQMRV